jgi:hypothetical protein
MEDRTLLSTFIVTNTDDGGPGSLRQAILDSDAAGGRVNKINFAIPGQGAQTIAPLSPLPAITNSVLIDGFSQPRYAGTPLIELSGSQTAGGDGLLITGSEVTVRGLDIDNLSQGAGIHVTGTGATANWIYGDFLGTDPTGTQAEPNSSGVAIDAGASKNLIGTDGDGVNDASEQNLISGNRFAGVSINGQGTDRNVVAGNLIGTDVSGTNSLQNGNYYSSDSYGDLIGGGIVIEGGASANRIGTDGQGVDDLGEQNVVAGSSALVAGIEMIGAGTNGNIVAGNFIGTDVTGLGSLHDYGNDGILIATGASANWVGVNPDGGAAVADEGNLISGTGSDGIQIRFGSNFNVVAGNKIGTNATGRISLGNSWDGVEIDSSSGNTIGGTGAGHANIISGNGNAGVELDGASGNLVEGNSIGTDATGTKARGNAEEGVKIDASSTDNTIGGTSAIAGNLITNNGGPGIAVTGDSSVRNQITADRIFGNTGRAIDLGGEGVTENAATVRQGPNDLQNFPIIITSPDGQTTGFLGGSEPDTTYRIDVFASAGYLTGGTGEAQDYLGSLEVVTDATGQVRFIVPFKVPAGSPNITATATDANGNTSEVTSLRRGVLSVPEQTIRLAPDQPVAFSADAANGITLQDPEAAPIDTTWQLNLSVSVGTLTLSGAAGLTGTGNGTGSLTYTGTLAALNRALAGMKYTPPAGFVGNPALILDVWSYGAAALEAQAQVSIVVTSGLFEVTSIGDSGPGTLRQAIVDSNAATGGTNTIDFAIPGAGLHTIAPTSPLPAVTNPVLIDGNSQTGFTGTPLINLSGQALAGLDPLTVASSVTVHGVAIGGFALDAVALPDVLTIPAVALSASGGSQGGTIDSYRLETTGGEQLAVVVHADGVTTRLLLENSGGDVLMQSDGQSLADGDDLINLYVPAGVYRLNVQALGGSGTYGLTATSSPATSPLQSIPTGISPNGIVAGNFNNDGRLDLAVANRQDNTVSVLLGNGDGSFAPQITYAVGSLPFAMLAGDFNGDGRIDLAALNRQDNSVSVLLGNGDGTFQPQVVTYDVGSSPECLAAGDFNHDGHLDLALGNQVGSTLSVLLGNGDGSFQRPSAYAVGPTQAGIVVSDFNGDGRPDLAVANEGDGYGNGSVTVLLGKGDGTFGAPVSFAAGFIPDAIVAGDFNDDGHIDLAVANYGDDNVSVFLSDGDGSFTPHGTYAVGSGPASLTLGDFNHDGHLDLAVASEFSSYTSVLLGKGDGSFAPQVTYEGVGSHVLSIAAGDFNGDGHVDLAVASAGQNIVSLSLGAGDGTFQPLGPVRTVVQTQAHPVVAGDFNGDGYLDLAVVNYFADSTVSVLLGIGDGTFQPRLTFVAGNFPGSIVAGDFNGDGRLDLAVANSGDDTLSVLLGDGDGSFQPAVSDDVGSDPMSLVAGDFNGDGRVDLAVANYDDSTVSVVMGEGDGTLAPQVTYAVGLDPVSLAVGDFNDDGHLDLAVTDIIDSSTGACELSVLLGSRDGTFAPPVAYTVGLDAFSIASGDFNGDGHLDLATANDGDKSVSVLLGNGDGTFRPQVTYAVGFNGISIVSGDFNGDGRVDLAVASVAADAISILIGSGDGTFQRQVISTYAVGSSPESLVVGDFNGDGHVDLALANGGDSTVLLNKGDGTLIDPGQLATTPHATPMVVDVNGDGTADLLVVEGDGNILYRQGISGQGGNFEPPVTVNPGFTSRDIAWVPRTNQGPLLASVDARDNAISLYAWRDGSFVRIGSLRTGQLPAQIIAADLSGSGWAGLVVRNAGDGTLSLFSGNGLGSVATGFNPFQPPITVFVGQGVSDVEAVDGSGGGIYLVVTNQITGEVTTLGDGSRGVVAALEPYRAGTGLYALDTSGSSPVVTSLEATAGVTAGAFTVGGPTDLVTINPGTETIGLLAGLGDGRFADPATLYSGSPARVVRVADFNQDGVPDLAVLTGDGVSIYLGNGNGGFLPRLDYGAGTDPTDLSVADITGDGRLDLLVGNAEGDVLILVGNGDGTFRPFEPVKAAIALAVADLTGNGVPDFIFADQSLDRVTVVYGPTPESSASPQVIANQSSGLLAPGAVELADLNGDGIPDLIVANSGGNDVLVYPGLGNGQFGPSVNGTQGFPVGTDPSGITVANLNGQPDLLVADTGSNDVSILLGQGSGSGWTMTAGPRIKTDAGPVAVAVGDVLGGGHTDLAVANSGADNVQVFPSVGSGFFNDQPQAIRTFSVGQDPAAIFLGNFNGLGTGLVTLNAGSNNGTLISNAGSPDPFFQTFATGGVFPTTAFAGNFSGDGYTDLVVGNNGDGRLALLLGGSGGLSLSQSFFNSAAPNPTAVSFGGVSDGILSFYVTTAGHEAALEMAFDLSSAGAIVGPGSPPPLGSSAVSGASILQIARLGDVTGSPFDLIATLVTVTVVPGNLESALEAGGGTALLASFGPGGSTGLGQSMRLFTVEDDNSGNGYPEAKTLTDASSARQASGPADRLAPWASFAVGLDEAWQELRARMTDIERAIMAPAADENGGAPGSPRIQAPAPSSIIPQADPSQPKTNSHSDLRDGTRFESQTSGPPPTGAPDRTMRNGTDANASKLIGTGLPPGVATIDSAIEALGGSMPRANPPLWNAPAATEVRTNSPDCPVAAITAASMTLSVIWQRAIVVSRGKGPTRKRSLSVIFDRRLT